MHDINEMDKNLGPANADKYVVIMECKRQLFDVVTEKVSSDKVQTLSENCISKRF